MDNAVEHDIRSKKAWVDFLLIAAVNALSRNTTLGGTSSMHPIETRRPDESQTATHTHAMRCP
jgi:hypothetical protein